jgi:hypothetical protein
MKHRPRPASRALGILAAIGLAALAGCSGGGRYRPASLAGINETPRYYPPPGPPEDPWGPYITEAASRFAVPEAWIRAVMRQESGGQQQAVSSAGAIGLMQLMPDTYADLRQQYGLGTDPFDPHDNVLAGTAYLRQMYDKFGAPGFLAAYDAGPQRLSEYLSDGTPLPDETVAYLASVAPELGPETTMTGPLAAYADTRLARAAPEPTARSFAAGCDADQAYDPDHPCHALEAAATAPAPVEEPVAEPAGPPVEEAAAQPSPQLSTEPEPQSAATPIAVPEPQPGWGIQVGAFADPGLARQQAARAEREEPDLLAGAVLSLPETTPFGGRILYRARLLALTETLAELACQRLNAMQLPCIIVRPDTA